MSGRLNINEQLKNYVPTFPSCNMTITLITTVSADLMAIFLPVCSLQLEASTPTIAAVTPAMTGLRILAYLQTPPPQTDLQHHIKHMKQNGTIGLQITYLQELPSPTKNAPSPHPHGSHILANVLIQLVVLEAMNLRAGHIIEVSVRDGVVVETGKKGVGRKAGRQARS